MTDPTSNPGSSFLALFLEHQAQLFGFVIANGVAPSDADDVLQNVAEVLWRRFDEFETGTNFRAWAFAVTRLEIRKLGDRRKRHARVICLDETALDALTDGNEVMPDAPELEQLRACMSKLGKRAQAMVRFHYHDGLPQAEVAERLGISHDAARTGLSRIRRQLAECIARNTPEMT